MSDNTIKEFLIELGFEIDQNTEKKFNQSIKGAVVQANLLADAIEGTMRVVAQGVEQMARNFSSLEFASQRTKSSVQSLKDFAYGFSQIGGSAEGAQAMVEKFAANLRSNVGNVSWLKSFGVPTQGMESVDQMIALIRKLYQQYPEGNNYGVGEGIAEKFGIDKESYYQLTHNLGALTEFRKQSKQTAKDLGLNSDEAAKKWKEFLQDFQQTSLVFKTVVEKVFTELEPRIQKSLEEFNAWLKENEPTIRADIEAIADAVDEAATNFGKLATAIHPVITAVDELIEKITGQKGLTFAIEVGFGAWTLSKIKNFLGLFGIGGSTGFWSTIGVYAASAGGVWSLFDPGQGLKNAPRSKWGVDDVIRSILGTDSTETHAIKLRKRGADTNAAQGNSGSGSPLASSGPGGGSYAEVGNFVSRGPENVDARLRAIIAEAARRSGFQIEAFSGYRPGDRRFHGRGMAMDVRIIDPKTGKPLPNYQDAASFATYEKLAQYVRQVQMEKYPELKDKLRWGGYLSGGPGKYGAMDLMHFDEGGGTVGMGGGSWLTGLTPAQRKIWPSAMSKGMAEGGWLKNADANLKSMSGTPPLGLGGSTTTNITVSPTTTVTVNGATDPHATANAIGNRLDSVNANVLRDTKGAVR